MKCENSEKKIVSLKEWTEKMAKKAEKAGHFEKSIRYYQQTLKMMRKSSKHRVSVSRLAAIEYRLGLLFGKLQKHEQAMEHIKVSIRLDSQVPGYFAEFGKGFMGEGNWEVARRQFELALRLDPDNDEIHRQISWSFLMLGRRDQARQHARRAVDLNPKSRENLWHLVRTYMESEMFSHSLRTLRKLRGYKEDKIRVDECEQLCQMALKESFEGCVLSTVRSLMKKDGLPFNLQEYRRAEELWLEIQMLPKIEGPKLSSRSVAMIIMAMLAAERGENPFETLSRMKASGPVISEAFRWLTSRLMLLKS